MLVLIALAVLLVVLLDRNHRPQGLAGSTDVDDRDRARVRADLVYAQPVTRHRRISARRAATARLASGHR